MYDTLMSKMKLSDAATVNKTNDVTNLNHSKKKLLLTLVADNNITKTKQTNNVTILVHSRKKLSITLVDN